MKIRPYEFNDIFLIEERPEDFYVDVKTDAYAAYIESGTSWTFIHEEEIAAIICGKVMWEGVGVIIATMSDSARGHAKYLVREVGTKLDNFVKDENLHRVETVMVETPEYIKWIKLLGFTHEFTKTKAGPSKENLLGFVKFYN